MKATAGPDAEFLRGRTRAGFELAVEGCGALVADFKTDFEDALVGGEEEGAGTFEPKALDEGSGGFAKGLGEQALEMKG